MQKRLKLLIIITIICIALAGCWDADEIDDNIYCITLGIDKGVDNKMIVTLQTPVNKESSGGGGGGNASGMNGKSGEVGNTIVNSVECASIQEGINLINLAVSREISLKHLKLIVVSEELAREGLSRYFVEIARPAETRRQNYTLVTKGKAVEFIKENTTTAGTSITKAVELIQLQSKSTGMFPISFSGDIYRNLFSPYGQPYMAYAGINDMKYLDMQASDNAPPIIIDKAYHPDELPRFGADKKEYVGTAVFEGEKMVGALDSDETKYFLMLIGEFSAGIIIVNDKSFPEYANSFNFQLGRRPKIKGYFKNGIPIIEIKLNLEAEIAATASIVEYEKLDKLKELEFQLKELIETKIKKLTSRTQREFKSDIFQFGTHFAGYFNTIKDWEKYNWLAHYTDAEITTTIEVNIRRNGAMIHQAKLFNKEGK